MRYVACALHAAGRRLWRAEGGAAAVEFVLIAPVLIALYLGATELMVGYRAQQKVQTAAAVVSDLVGREETLTKADIGGLFNVAERIIFPHDPAHLAVRVAIVEEKGDKTPVVVWSQSTDGRGPPSAETLAKFPHFSEARDDVGIVVETWYDYTPFSAVFDDPFQLTGLSIWKGRQSRIVECSDC